MTKVVERRSMDPSIKNLKVLPHSIEAEQSVLGGLMLDNQAWDRIAERVSPTDFYRTEHQDIFKLIAKLAEQAKPFDVVTLSEELDKVGKLEKSGGLSYLGELAKNTPSAANISAYADIVRERSILRRLIQVSGEIADSAFFPDGRASRELLDSAERKVFEIAETQVKSTGPLPIKPLLTKAVEKIDFLSTSKSKLTGVSTGFKDLDNLTSGLQASDLIIVAGRPSMGKTSFAMNLAEHALIKDNKPILVFSMEMPADSIVMRMMSSLGHIDQSRIRSGRLADDDWPRLTAAVNLLADKPLFIDDTAALNPTELRARARRVVRENGPLGVIIIDYLQLMRVPGLADNRVAEISEISRSLKAG